MFDFPSNPVDGQIYGGYIYQGGVWLQNGAGLVPTAEARNRVVNGAMQISQEIGNTAGTGSNNYYADQWQSTFTVTGTFTGQRVQVLTPNGSQDRLRMTITAGDVSLAATDFLLWKQDIEGIRIADFKWGTAAARQVVLRFGFKGPAGTYSTSLLNDAGARSYIVNFTISAGQANTDTEQVFVIPGDTTGTWPTGTGRGMILDITLACGSNYIGVPGWQAGGLYGTSANTNGAATNGSVFEIFDVGLYLDRQATGLPPPWQMPDYAAELLACQRYWQWVAFMFYGSTTSANAYLGIGKVICQMRAGPAVGNAINVGNGGFPATPGAFVMFNFLGGGISENRVANATGVGYFQTVAAANARM